MAEVHETEPLIRPSSLPSDDNCWSRKDPKLWNHLNDPTGPDPKLVFAAHNFVQDIIEKAKAEAAKRLKSQQHKKNIHLAHNPEEKGSGLSRGAWKRRWTHFVTQVYKVFWSCVGSTYYA